jgi:hypothetical protein
MKPANYKIVANSRDITQQIKDRFISLSIHDDAGEQSDTVTITLDNRDNKINFPSTGAALDVSIGLGESLVFKGTYEVDELTEPLDDDTLTIHGKASNMKSSFKAPKDASFDNISFGDLVGQIANAHNYTPAIADELAAVTFEHLDQVAESDMNLLTRLARDNGAIAKPVANRLVVVKKGESKTVSGKSLPEIAITDPENSTGTVTIQERNDYQSVTATWFDEQAQQTITETAGSGAPVFTMRSRFKDAKAALAAADAKLKSLQRGTAEISLGRPLMADVVPEGVIVISNHKTSANGRWLVESVDHVIEAGSTASTSIKLVIPK